MRTYKELQDAVLQWMADSGDTGLLRTLVKDALNRAHQNLLNDDRYDFLLWPRTETLSVTVTVPQGVTLSAGTNNGNGTWTLTGAQANLSNLTMTVPEGTPNFTVGVTATSSASSRTRRSGRRSSGSRRCRGDRLVRAPPRVRARRPA